MYAIDRKHKKIIQNGSFQHHGIMGQKWGTITRNVGVNYIPTGERNRSGSDTPLSDKKRSTIDNAIDSHFKTYSVKLPENIKSGIYKHVQNSRIAKNTDNERITKLAVDMAVSKARRDFDKGFNKYLKENGISGFGEKSWKALEDYTNMMYANNSIDVTEAFGWRKGDLPSGVQLKALMVNEIPIEFSFTYGGKAYSSKNEAIKAANR